MTPEKIVKQDAKKLKVKSTGLDDEDTTGMGTRTKTVRDGQPAHSVRLICVLCYNCQSGYQMAGCWGCSRQAYVNTDRPPLPLAPGRALSVRHGRVPCGTEEP